LADGSLNGRMALKPKEGIGAEVHNLDQFFRVEEGSGEVILDGIPTAIRAGFSVIVPAGTNHDIINTGSVPQKLYTLYSPPNHRDGVIHHTRETTRMSTTNTSTAKRRSRESTTRRPGEEQELSPVAPPDRDDPGGKAARRN